MSGTGCYYGNLHVDSLAYADDVILFSPTLALFKEMLKIWEQYSHDFKIIFNVSKTKLMFGKNVPDLNVSFQGKIVSKVNNEAHVGNIISTDISNNTMSISKACNKMYAQTQLTISAVWHVFTRFHIHSSIVIVCHCMLISYGITETGQ